LRRLFTMPLISTTTTHFCDAPYQSDDLTDVPYVVWSTVQRPVVVVVVRLPSSVKPGAGNEFLGREHQF